MKKALLLIFGLLVLPTPGWTQEADPCEGFGGRIIVLDNLSVENAFREYTDPRYRSPDGDEILLCFTLGPGLVWEERISPFGSPLTLNNLSGLPVVISGLNIRGSAALGNNYLLSLSGADPVIVRDSSFSNCVNCLSLRNDSMRVENSVVECSGRDVAGTGIRLLGEAHQVIRSQIQTCATGVLIGRPPKVAGNNNSILETVLHDNNVAIRVFMGQRNYFRNNSVYHNDANGDLFYSNVEGIELAEGTNGGLGIPMVFDLDGNPLAATGEIMPVLDYPGADCVNTSWLSGPWTAEAAISVRVPHDGEGELEISRANESANLNNEVQGRIYLTNATCSLPEPGARESYNADCRFLMSKDYENHYAVVLFNHPDYGSSSFSYLFNLNGPCGPGVVSAPSVEAPEATMGGGMGSVESAAGIGDSALADTDDSDDEGSSMAANPVGGGGVSAGGLGGSGAPGGSGGCGGSLNPNLPYGAWHYMVIFLLPPVFLIRLRNWYKN